MGSSSSESVPLVLSKGLGSSCPINIAGSGGASWFPWIVRKPTDGPGLPAAGANAHPCGERVGEDSNLLSPPFLSSTEEAGDGNYCFPSCPFIHVAMGASPAGHGQSHRDLVRGLCMQGTVAMRAVVHGYRRKGCMVCREFKTVMELTGSRSAFPLTKALQF